MKKESNNRLSMKGMIKKNTDLQKYVADVCDPYNVEELVETMMEILCDGDTVQSVLSTLSDMYEKDMYDELAGAIRILYLTFDVGIPEIVDSILRWKNKKVRDMFFYEFLMDFDDIAGNYEVDFFDNEDE